MRQCVSDSNPYDDEPDWIEIGELFLKRHTLVHNTPRTGLLELLRKACIKAGRSEEGVLNYYTPRPTTLDCALDIIQGLLEHIEENV